MNVNVVTKFAESVRGAFKAGAEDFVKFAENGLKKGDVADMKAAGKVLKEKTSLAKDTVNLENAKKVFEKSVKDESGVKVLSKDVNKADVNKLTKEIVSGEEKIKNFSTEAIDVAKNRESIRKEMKARSEAVLAHFTAEEQKMFKALKDAGKAGDKIAMAENIPSKAMTKLYIVEAKEYGKKLVAENGEALKSWGGKLLKDSTGELFTGKIDAGDCVLVVKNGLIKAMETATDVIKLKV